MYSSEKKWPLLKSTGWWLLKKIKGDICNTQLTLYYVTLPLLWCHYLRNVFKYENPFVFLCFSFFSPLKSASSLRSIETVWTEIAFYQKSHRSKSVCEVFNTLFTPFTVLEANSVDLKSSLLCISYAILQASCRTLHKRWIPMLGQVNLYLSLSRSHTRWFNFC